MKPHMKYADQNGLLEDPMKYSSLSSKLYLPKLQLETYNPLKDTQ